MDVGLTDKHQDIDLNPVLSQCLYFFGNRIVGRTAAAHPPVVVMQFGRAIHTAAEQEVLERQKPGKRIIDQGSIGLQRIGYVGGSSWFWKTGQAVKWKTCYQ